MPFVSFDEPSGFVDFDAPEPAAEPRGILRAAGDTAVQFGKGAVSGVRMLTDLAGADNAVSGKLRSAAEALDGLLSASAQQDQRRVSEIMQEAEGKGWGDQIVAGLKAAGVAPGALLAQAAGTALPTIGAALIPGVGQAGLIARAGMAGMGAAQGAGSVKGSIYDTTKAELLAAGASPEEAEARAAQAQEYAGPNAGQIALGAGLGAVAGSTGAERAVSALRSGVTKAPAGIIGRVMQGGVTEAIPEALQGGQEKYATNTALANEGFDVDPTSGMVANAVLEGAAGFGMGAGLGVAKPKNIGAKPAAEEPAADPLQIGNTPDPLISFPDGTVGRRADVDRYVNSLPENQQVAARARLMGMGEKKVEVTDILAAPDADSAIDAFTASLTGTDMGAMLGQDNPLIAPARAYQAEVQADQQDLGDLVQTETRDLQVMRANTLRDMQKQRELDAIQSEGTGQYGVRIDEKPAVEQAATLEAPTAMQLAMQKAMQRAKSPDANSVQLEASGPVVGAPGVRGVPAPVAGPELGPDVSGLGQGDGAAGARGAGQPASQPPLAQAGVLAGDITRLDGQPFQTANGARLKQREAGGIDGSDVVEVPGGFVVRPKPTQATAPDAGAAAPDAPAQVQPATGGTVVPPDTSQPSNGALKPVGRDNPITGPREAAVVVDSQGREYLAHSQRNDLVIAHPIVDGKPQVNRDSAVRFWTNPDTTPSGENDRTDPIYLKEKPSAQANQAQPGTQKPEAGAEVPTPGQPAAVAGVATPDEAGQPAQALSGEKIDAEWTAFTPESGTKGIPRAEMPQIKAEHRGAMTQFLAARGITHETVDVPAGDLKPTQAEFSPGKVAKAKGFTDTDRSILISSDGHILDGHHQWVAALEDGKPIKAIRLDAPIEKLLAEVKEFPSAQAAAGATKPVDQRLVPVSKRVVPREPTVEDQTTAEFERLYQEDIKADIRQRLGLEPKAKEEKATASAFRSFLREFGIKPSHAADVTGERDVESASDNGGVNRLVEMIQAEIRGERQVSNEMANDDAQAQVERVQRMEIEDAADRLGLPYEADISTDRLASMVARVQRALEAKPNGLLKPERIRRNAIAAAQRIEAKREQFEADLEEFAKSEIEVQNAILEVFMDADGEPAIVRQIDADREAAWNTTLGKWEDQNGQADTAEDRPARQAGPPERGPAQARAGDDQEAGAQAQRGGAEGQSEGLTAPTRADILRQQADAEAEAQRREDGGDKPLPGKKVTGDTPDMFNTQGSVFDQPADPEPTPAAQASEILDAANITGKDRLDILKDVKSGALTPDEVQAAYPEAKPEPADEPDRNGMRAADRYARDLASAAQEVASQIYGDFNEDDFDPAEVRPGLQAFAKDAGVPADELRQAVLKNLRASDMPKANLRKVEKALDPTKAPAATSKIDDFGEKLEGAKKDRAPSLSKELTDDAIATEPFSKIWPADEVDGIEDKFAAAVATAARAEVPAKPRVAYKVKRWVESVKSVRSLAQFVVSGKHTRDEFMSKMLERRGLDGFTAKVVLMEAIDRAQWGRIGKVNEYPKAYHYDEAGKQVESPVVRVEVDGKNHNFGGALSVADVVERVNGLLGQTAEDKKMQFEVRGSESRGFGINKKGDKEYRRLKTFPTSKEAFAYIQGNYDDLVAAWDDVKARDNVKESDVRGAANRARTAEDYRDGQDVTPEKFAETFGFRGVQFGNWVAQGAERKARQGMLNEAYDALMDLSNILKVPPKAISLNSTLGLSFGARGSGWASAHYEPGNLVINLTKTRGAGTLAHEWFHALDNYFSHQRGGEIPMKAGMSQQEYRQKNYITYRPEPMYVRKDGKPGLVSKAQLDQHSKTAGANGYYKAESWQVDPRHPQGVRPEVERAFAGLVEALNASPMKARSLSLGSGENDYWSQIIERGARSFENYVIAKMMEKGYHNDYLANVRPVEDFPRSKERYPYLLPEEVAPVAEAFDGLFETIQTREDDAGNVAMLARGDRDGGSPGRLSPTEVRTITAPIGEKLGIDVIVVQTPADLPIDAPSDARGLYLNGKVYVVASNVRTRADVLKVVGHEAVAHLGLRQLLGRDGWFKMMGSMQLALKAGNKPLREISAEIRKLYVDEDGKFNLTPDEEADEIAAAAVERAIDPVSGEFAPGFGWLKSVFARVAEWLREQGIRVPFSNLELQGMLVRAMRNLEGRAARQPAGEVVAAARGTKRSMDLAPTGMFVSMGGRNYGVESFAEAGEKYRDTVRAVKQRRADGDRNVEVPFGGQLLEVRDGAGAVVAYAAANGRVYPASDIEGGARVRKGGKPSLYDPYAGMSAEDGAHPENINADPSGWKPRKQGQLESPAPDTGGAMLARSAVTGQTSRQHTPAQLRAMKNVGFQVEVPTIQERAQALWKDAGKKMAQGIVDQFAPVKALDGTAYGLLRLAKGASGAFEAFLKGGKLKLSDNVYDFDETQKGGVVDKLLIPLQGEHHDFMRWVAANRAERLAGEGKENLFSAQDIADLKTLASGTTAFDYTIQTGPAAGRVTRDRTLIYADSLRVFNGFNKNILDMAEQSGLIDPESRKLWEHEFYVPFYRVADDADGGIRGASIKGGVVRQAAFKALKGGKNALNADLLDNTLMNWAHLLDAAAKNRAAKATIEAAERMGVAAPGNQSTLAQMATSINNKNGVVWFMDGGQKRYSLIDDPYLMTALTSLEYAGMRNPVMNAMSAFKHALTVGVTASPFFKIRNLIRDSVQVIGTSSISPNLAGNVSKGWALTDPKSDAYFRLLAGGGTIHFGTMLEGSEAKRVQALVESGVDDATILGNQNKVKQFYRRYIEPGITAYNELGNRGEAINRASLYDQLMKQGMGHAEASLQARDLMDFSMQGSFTTIRFLTQTVPFMNARLQGLYRLGRGAKEDPARFAAVVGAAAVMSIALLAAYSDDDDWKKREEWDRNNYWWFKFGGTAFRIPKPFEIGAIATLAERGWELAFEKEMTGNRFRKQVLDLLGDNLSMNPVPQLIKPIVDVYANKDSFSGRPIETMSMERLKSDYRFNDRTSMTARGASTALNSVTGLVGAEALSPVQIDHMLRGYFGWLGAFVVGAGDVIARPATNQPTHAAPDYWKVATGGILSDVKNAPSRYVSQMYDQAKEIEQAYGTWRALQKEGKVAEAGEFARENKEKLDKYRKIGRVKRTESSLNERIRMVERSNMDADTKRTIIQGIQAQKDQVARAL